MILNGTSGIDNKGEFTRAETKDVGNSVLDYFISNSKLTKYELAIKYWPFNDLSDHRPI